MQPYLPESMQAPTPLDAVTMISCAAGWSRALC